MGCFPPKLFACWVIFHAFYVVCWLFSKLTFSKHYQSLKQFEFRSGPTFCQSHKNAGPTGLDKQKFSEFLAYDLSAQKNRLDSFEYPQHMFRLKNKKVNVTHSKLMSCPPDLGPECLQSYQQRTTEKRVTDDIFKFCALRNQVHVIRLDILFELSISRFFS